MVIVSFFFKPLYGLLQAKLQLITHAYFEEKDFSQISILKVTVYLEKDIAFENGMGAAGICPQCTVRTYYI